MDKGMESVAKLVEEARKRATTEVEKSNQVVIETKQKETEKIQDIKLKSAEESFGPKGCSP